MTVASFVLELVPLAGKMNSNHTHKMRFWYLFKISNDHPRHFDTEVPPPRGNLYGGKTVYSWGLLVVYKEIHNISKVGNFYPKLVGIFSPKKRPFFSSNKSSYFQLLRIL